MKTIILLSIITLLFACSSKKYTTTTSSATPVPVESTPPTDEELRVESILKAGYQKGVIVDKSSAEGCGFMVELSVSKQLLWVPKLEDRFKKEGTLVWIKYRPSKMPSNCALGIPAIIEEIKIIE